MRGRDLQHMAGAGHQGWRRTADAGGSPGDAPTDRQQAEGLLAALIFAVHPIHTEAVAGIVGQAELLSAAMSILALLTYIRACWPGWASTTLPTELSSISLSPCAIMGHPDSHCIS